MPRVVPTEVFEGVADGKQVRSAYRKRGWAFGDPQGIEQCAKEGYVEKLREQAGEGCHMWGELAINKACPPPCQTPFFQL